MLEQTELGGLHVRRGGSGPPLLYVHGLGESGLCFERLIADPRLDGLTHLCPDLPGYGKSPWCAEPLTLAAQAERIAAWLEAVGVEPVVVLGHSMGGVIGLMLCERRPDLVRGLLDVEGNVSLDDCGYSSLAAADERRAFLEGGFAALLERFFDAGARDPVVRDYFVSVRICDPRAYHLNSVELVELSGGEELARRRAALALPLLYLLGDPRGTGARSRAMLDEAGVPWRPIPDAGHWPFRDQQALFVGELLRFLGVLR